MEKKNFYGVKIGDIFYKENIGIGEFYQVVDLKGSKQVIIRQIDKEQYEKVCDYQYKIRPIKDKFLPKEKCRHKDKFEGITKNVMKKAEDGCYKGKLYLSIESGYKNYRDDFLLWEGEEIIDDYWMIWMK